MYLFKHNIRFNRNEVAGSFGDIGTDLPLIIGIIVASGIDTAPVLIMFGIMLWFTGLKYGIPMSVQPLKAFATIIIAQKLTGNLIFGGGLAIGIIMLLLTLTGTIDRLAKIIPKSVIRGVQFGLGIQLCMLAIKNYIVADSWMGYVVAAIAFVVIILLFGNKRYPPAIFVVILGILYAVFLHKANFAMLGKAIHVNLPLPNVNFTFNDVINGLLLLALPQIPLSLGNSIFATAQASKDLFPEKQITVRRISLTYSIMNIINPFFGGIPTCHGSGGMAGHYIFGARTAGSVLIYGSFFLIIGIFFANGFSIIASAFPLPILGILLFFEGLTLLSFMKDMTSSNLDFYITLMVGLISGFLPYGYAIGIIVGVGIYYFSKKWVIGYGK